MRCPECDHENPVGSKFCIKCGARFNQICPKCGAGNRAEATYCGHCGHSLLPERPRQPQRRWLRVLLVVVGAVVVLAALSAGGLLLCRQMGWCPTPEPIATGVVQAQAVAATLTTGELPSLSETKHITASTGGSVSLPDGSALVLAPAALTSDADVTLSVQSPGEHASIPNDIPAAIMAEVVIDGGELQASADLTLSYASLSPDGLLVEDALFVAQWLDGQWRYLGGEVDTERLTVGVEADQGGLFGLFELPTIDELLILLRTLFGTCEAPYVWAEHWTDLVADIARSNPDESLPEMDVYLKPGLGMAGNLPNCYILVDPEGFLTNAKWIPSAQYDLLAAPMLGHELSHQVRGNRYGEIAWETLKEMLSPQDWKELGTQLKPILGSLWLAILRNDHDAALTLSQELEAIAIDWLGEIDSAECDVLRQEEFTCDLNGVTWASQTIGDANAVGLVFSHVFESALQVESCANPLPAKRAEQIRTQFAMGEEGGLYGTVKEADSGLPLEGAAISVDGIGAALTDADGKYLITGLSPGQHTFSFSHPKFSDAAHEREIASQRLTSLTLELQPHSETPTSPPAPPEAPPGFSDDFGSPNLNPGWTWVDPIGDSSYSLTANPGHLRLYTPDGGHDLYLNLNAPRMVQQVAGDFVARTKVTIDPQYTYQGAGLLIWQDSSNYIRIERNAAGIQFAYRIGGTYFDLNPDPYTSQTTVYLQFARTGNTFVASFSNDGTDWQDVYTVRYPAASTLYVGPSLLNEWQNNPIWADFDYLELRFDE